MQDSQNDIKKLRRENEQLRREIWSLRDEYDKLEEILKRQKSRAESEEYEDQSNEDDGLHSDYSVDEDEQSLENGIDSSNELTKSEQLENAENQKISSEKMTNSFHRLHVDFDDLSVVDEEEELKRDKDKKDASSEDIRPLKDEKTPLSILKPRQLHENIPFYPGTHQQPCLSNPSYYTECPFKFPNTTNFMMPPETSMVTPPCPRLTDPLLPVPNFGPNIDPINDQVLHAPPLGWQTNIVEGHNVGLNGLGIQTYGIQEPGFPSFPSFPQKRNIGLKSATNPFNATPFINTQPDKVVENGWSSETDSSKVLKERSLELLNRSSEEKVVLSTDKPKHFFAPLPSKVKKQTEESSPITSHFETATSSSSGKTGSTVISKDRFSGQKGSADIYVKGAVPCEDLSKSKSEQRTYLSTDNLLVNDDKPCNQLTKSMSCQDLSSENQMVPISHTEGRQPLMTQSDNTLDNISDSKPYKSHLTVTLKTPKMQQAISPDTPEIPQLPSIEYRIFKNPFLRNFEPSCAYMNQNNATRPLSVQVNDDNLCYYSPQPEVATLNKGARLGDRYRQIQTDQNRLLIPSSQLANNKLMSPTNKHQIQVTSFERPSPHTLIGPSSPYDYSTIRRLNPAPYIQNQNLYQNVPFVQRGVYPQRGMMYYDTITRKVPAQTQTSIDGDSHHEDEHALFHEESAPSTPSGQRCKRIIKREKCNTIKEQKPLTPIAQRRLKKQSSVATPEVPESPGRVLRKRPRKLSITTSTTSEYQEDKNESRSSSSGQDSPKKDQLKRVSLYFNSKKRPSLTSLKTTRSGSLDVSKERDVLGSSDRERTNSVSSREAVNVKIRKASTSSGSVPWCACWGNGCV